MMRFPGSTNGLPAMTVVAGRATGVNGGQLPDSAAAEVFTESDSCGYTSNVEMCSTSWTTPVGSTRPNAPGDAPCGPEASWWVKTGRRPLRDVYSSCKLMTLVPDVPNNDLGVLSCFRDVCAFAQGAAQSLNSVISQDMAATNTFLFTNVASGDRVAAVGVHVEFTFLAAQTTAPAIRIQTNGFVTIVGAPVARNTQLQLLESCLTGRIFLPFARQQGANVEGQVAPNENFPLMPPWAPVCAFTPAPNVEPPDPTCSVVVSGFPAGVGKVITQLVGANSPMLPEIFGAMNNGKLAA